MESLTKNRQSLDTINKMVKKAFNNLHIINIEELKEGFFNIAFLIKLSNNSEVILKIAPPKDALIMTYEKNIMYSEVNSMEIIFKETKVPVAEILFYDNSHTLCESDYFFINKLSGKSLNVLMDEITDEEKKNIYYDLGKYNAQINNITGKKFGYYGQKDKQGKNWFEVFVSMVKDTINAVNVMNIDVGVEAAFIMKLLIRDKEFFEEVITPKLVHWDLWAGNVFVNKGIITGLIDFERCLWADELLEVGFRTYEYNEDFFEGYGAEKLNKSQQVRARWYDVYLFLIASLECDYRNYQTRDTYNWATEMLKESIDELQRR